MWVYDYKTKRDNPYRYPPFLEITHMSYVDNLPFWTYPGHEHTGEYEVGFIVRGKGQLEVNEQFLPIQENSITIVPADTSHRYVMDGNSSVQYYTLRFKSAGEGELLKFFSALGCAVTSGEKCASYIHSSIHMLFSIHRTNGGYVDEVFQSVCLSLLQLVRTLFDKEATSLQLASQYFMSQVREYIQRNHREKITLESLSQKFNISTSHLSRMFKKAYDMSPIDYLIYCRITYATEYLLKSKQSVAEIAQLVGYDNPTHFTNMFVKRIGCTPTEYRERNLQIPVGE